MVKAADSNSRVDGWREVFERSRFVPAHSQTVRRTADSPFTQSHGFQLSLSRLTAAHLPQETVEGEYGVTYQLRVTLFDTSHQHFFGKTWRSSPQRLRNNKISFSEVLYFHTSLQLPSTVAVVELAALSLRPDGSQHALGRGFTVLELFTNRLEAPAANGPRRLSLHHGSPRGLLHPLLKDAAHHAGLLKIIEGAHLDCVIKSHPAVVSVMHLLPENVLVSGGENIPGLAASLTGDALLRPQLLKMFPSTLSRLTVSLQPSLEKFENHLLQLINADCHNMTQPGPEDTLRTFVIQERRLHVGVHNGWCFLENPQVVILEPLTSAGRAGTDGTSKQSALTKDSLASTSVHQLLGLRSSLELKLTNHKALAVIFQLEYVFCAPAGRENMLSATVTSRAAFLQSLRWGVWCPFQEPADWKGEEVRLALHGGAEPNPHGVMVYSTETPAKTNQVSEENDVITFRLTSSLEKKESSPKASPKTKREDESQQRRSPSSPSQRQKYVQPTSPPDSPQGPGLSLSQLAATSRYPTISHSSSALPWQQSFPSLLHPSPLASAHQLSHVACPAASNITHLEMDQPDGEKPSSSQDDVQLQELPFTPVHAPVITLGMNVPSSSSVSSRSSLAHLYSAGFPDIVDCSGQVAEVLEPAEPVLFDPQREQADLLQGNLVVFQFLAFSRIQTAGVCPDWPDNIYFTFQFYRFPPITSQQLKLLTSDKQQPGDPLPCVLASVNRDGTVNSGCPGLQVQFRVDGGFLKPGEKRWFLRYLALHTMQIDVWDSDSLLLIGSTAIELKHMLRQGKPAVQALHQVEVLTTDYVGEDPLLNSADGGQRSTASPMAVHTVLRGRLHVRTGNIGCSVDPSQKGAWDATSSHSHIITPRKLAGSFRGGSLSPRNFLQHHGKPLHLTAR